MTDTHYFFIIIIIAGVVIAFNSLKADTPLTPKRKSARVEWVKDGDSFRINRPKTDLRLWGVDAPEKGEEGADRARNALIGLIKDKRISYIQMDTDRYGRIVARVFLRDGREVNRLLIEQGAAAEYCRYSKGFYGGC